ncbi:four helix bundle protein [Flavobacteriaceae bacterium TK19130]|nr:four helix bundle protein [Thermobacterium salinum]
MIYKRLVNFSASIIKDIGFLEKTFASNHLSQQLIRSSSAAALNYGEAQASESKKDFIHKMKLCLKELRESQVNLQILQKAELIKDSVMYEKIYNECTELVAIFAASLKTSQVK